MFGKCVDFSRYPMQSVGLTRTQWIRHLTTVLTQTRPNPKLSDVDMTWHRYLEFNYRVSFTLYTFGRRCISSFSTSHAVPSYFLMPFIHVLPQLGGDFELLLSFHGRNVYIVYVHRLKKMFAFDCSIAYCFECSTFLRQKETILHTFKYWL